MTETVYREGPDILKRVAADEARRRMMREIIRRKGGPGGGFPGDLRGRWSTDPGAGDVISLLDDIASQEADQQQAEFRNLTPEERERIGRIADRGGGWSDVPAIRRGMRDILPDLPEEGIDLGIGEAIRRRTRRPYISEPPLRGPSLNFVDVRDPDLRSLITFAEAYPTGLAEREPVGPGMQPGETVYDWRRRMDEALGEVEPEDLVLPATGVAALLTALLRAPAALTVGLMPPGLMSPFPARRRRIAA